MHLAFILIIKFFRQKIDFVKYSCEDATTNIIAGRL